MHGRSMHPIKPAKGMREEKGPFVVRMHACTGGAEAPVYPGVPTAVLGRLWESLME